MQVRPHKIELTLSHRVEVGETATYLLTQLDCDNWYVACQHEHLLVIELTKENQNKYAVCFECTAPVDKAIYHGCRAWSLSIQPLGGEPELSSFKVAEISAGLAKLK